MNRAATMGIAILLLSVGVARAQEGPSGNPLQTSAWRNSFRSPRIEALKKQIAAGNRNTEAFWQQVAKEGTPLIEPSKEGEKHQLVTFLWRGTPETRNVLVGWYPFAAFRITDYLMTRVSSTDVWYLTVRAPRGARFAYSLSQNVPLNDLAIDPLRGAPEQADPLNRLRYFFPSQSRVELPGAAAQPWAMRRGGLPEGAVKTDRLASKTFASELEIAVYTPPRYRADGMPCALFVVFDGRSYLGWIPGPTTLDNLIAASKIPPTVAVFVSNRGTATRGEDFMDGPVRGDGKLETFLSKELVPWIRARYNVTRDPRLTVIGGSSAGAFAATYAALRLPDIFGNVLSQSGPFGFSPQLAAEWKERGRHMPDSQGRASQPEIGDDHDPAEMEDQSAQEETDWMVRQFINSPKLPLRFYLDAGLFEVDGLVAAGGGILAGTRHFRDVLLAKGYEVHYQMFIGGHDYLSWRGTLADGLIALIGQAENASQQDSPEVQKTR